MIEYLKSIDNYLLVALNGSDSIFWDSVFWYITKVTTWIPLLLLLLYVVLRNGDMRRFLFVVLALSITVLLADRLSSGLIKPLVMRWRPTHDATFLHTIDVTYGYLGGRFGFVSSHAANTFAVFTFLSLLFRSRLMTFSLLVWACLSSYSRVYLGVHFPGDIFCGAILGVVVGALIYKIYDILNRKYISQRIFYSSAYTTSGFRMEDINLLTYTMVLSYLVIILLSVFVCK